MMGKHHFYDAVNVMHDVITTADPIPYTAKFMFDCVGAKARKLSVLPTSLDIFDIRQH